MQVKKLAAIFVVIGFLFGCATFQTVKDNPFSTWSAKKKLTYAINVYSSEYDKYKAAILRDNLTDNQKDYLRTKRQALVALDKAIGLLIPIVDSGGQLPADLELTLLNLLGQLGYQPM